MGPGWPWLQYPVSWATGYHDLAEVPKSAEKLRPCAFAAFANQEIVPLAQHGPALVA